MLLLENSDAVVLQGSGLFFSLVTEIICTVLTSPPWGLHLSPYEKKISNAWLGGRG